MSDKSNLASLAAAPNRRQLIVRAAVAFGGLAIGSISALARAGADEISHSAESIHMEPIFNASRKRVYEALTDARQFDKVVQLSDAMKGGMPPAAAPTSIKAEAGSAFALFGGYVTGRQIEIVPNQRIVQAWRSGSWDAGSYSIAKFELVDQDSRTKIVFDHGGFPIGQAQHLADGWRVNYWEPLAKFLAQS